MYGIFPYIYRKNQPNVGKHTVHGSYGMFFFEFPKLFWKKNTFRCNCWGETGSCGEMFIFSVYSRSWLDGLLCHWEGHKMRLFVRDVQGQTLSLQVDGQVRKGFWFFVAQMITFQLQNKLGLNIFNSEISNFLVREQGCRFVPYTFSETIHHRWYQAGSKYWWNQGLAALMNRAKSTTLEKNNWATKKTLVGWVI